jgi:hypothetical protein
MLETDGGTVRRVAWPEIFPWLGLGRAFRVAISLRVLVFGAVGFFLTLEGWWALAKVLPPHHQPPPSPYAEIGDSSWPKPGQQVLQTLPPTPPGAPQAGLGVVIQPAAVPLLGAWMHLTRPAWIILRDGYRAPPAVAYCVLALLWATAVWALFGGAISRVAAVQLAADERIGWMAALRFACRKWLSYFAAPLLPLLGVILAAIPLAVLGLLMHFNVGVLLAGVLWPLALLGGLVMALLLLGLAFGWPLMWATISTEGTDSFDALSRSYAYVFQRPLRYLFYVLVAAVLGWLGWLLVETFAGAVVALSYWAAGWGAGPRIGAMGMSGLGRIFDVGSGLIGFWTSCVAALALGYFYGYFWIAASAIYLLLRRDVDATETDEVFLDADRSEPTHALPPLGTDEQGAPVAEG